MTTPVGSTATSKRKPSYGPKIPPQVVEPSDVGGAGQPSFAPALGVSAEHRRAVQGLVGASSDLHHVRQMQGYLPDEAQAAAHQPIELEAVGQSGEGITQETARVTVEIPFCISVKGVCLLEQANRVNLTSAFPRHEPYHLVHKTLKNRC